MTIARAAAIGSLIVAIVAVGVLMFGSGGGTEYTVHLQSANQLVKGNEVKVGGIAVGEITDIQLAEDNQADIKVTINEDFAPLHVGTEATVRVTSLPSVANRYISLHPGPNNAAEIDEGGVLETDETTNAVDLDQLFNTLDPPTRKGLQDTLQGFAGWYVGQSENLNETFKYLGPSLGNFTRVMQELARDQKTFTDLVVNGARAVSAIAERRDDLSALVQNGNTFARAIAAENESFDRALQAFPDVLRRARDTFKNLRGALVELNELTDVSKPQIKGLAPFLRDLTGLVKNAAARVQGPRPADEQPRPGQRLDRPHAPVPRARAPRAREHQELRRRVEVRSGRGRVPAALRAGDLGLDLALRPGAGVLRRKRPLRPRAADLQRLRIRRGREPAERTQPGRAQARTKLPRYALLPRRRHAACA